MSAPTWGTGTPSPSVPPLDAASCSLQCQMSRITTFTSTAATRVLHPEAPCTKTDAARILETQARDPIEARSMWTALPVSSGSGATTRP
eukprot:11595137-Heterocapsa_arctica.AAC.1